MKRQFLWCGAFLAAAAIIAPSSRLVAQEDMAMADPADVGSIDAIMTAVYDVISGPAGPRDWDRFRSLFSPGAQLIPTGRSESGEVGTNRNTVDGYIAAATGFFSREPFFEVEINRVTERYGNIAHAFSTYESRRSPDEEPFVRGINSFQLIYDGDRWWVVNIYWADENLSGPIPAKYTASH